MSQIALPVSDVSVTDWTPTPVWDQVNLPTPDDAHLVTSGTSPGGARFKVNLAQLARPGSGAQVLTVRLKQTGTPAILASVTLWQGTTAIAGGSFQPTALFSDYAITLSAAEIARITDYANLQVEIATSLIIACCPDPLPIKLHLTGNLGLGTIALTYDGSRYWASSPHALSCGPAAQFRLECTGTHDFEFALDVTCGTVWVPMGLDLGTASCSPFNLDYRLLIGGFDQCSPCNEVLTASVTT